MSFPFRFSCRVVPLAAVIPKLEDDLKKAVKKDAVIASRFRV